MGKVYNIKFFGDFSICAEQDNGTSTAILEDEFHSSSVICMLSYLIKNHGKIISSQELIELLWDDDETDYKSALKNLVYRARNILRKLDPEEQFILTKKNAYYWNPNIDIKLDIDEFNKAYQNGKLCEGKVKEKEYDLAFSQYSGRFLQNHQNVYEVVSTSIYYESLFRNMVIEQCEAYLAENAFKKMEELATLAINQNPLNEEFHCYLIRALAGQEKIDLALAHYKKAEELLYEKLDLNMAEKLRETWPILMEQLQPQKKTIAAIVQELFDDDGKGAFYCEYGTFKRIFQLEKRRAERLGVSIYMSIIAIDVVAKENVKPEKRNDQILVSMKDLREIIINSLRSGDVVSRYSKNQYILLLPTCQDKTTQRVMGRIVSAFEKKHHNSNFRLEYSYMPV